MSTTVEFLFSESDGYSVCPFCGKKAKDGYDEYNLYHYCTCGDYKKTVEIERKIAELKRQMPRHRYSVVRESVIVAKEK